MKKRVLAIILVAVLCMSLFAGCGGGTNTSSGGGSGYVSGVITSASGDSITIMGDDGNSYTIYTGAAEISASSGLNSGVYVNVGYSVNADGSLSASAVTG